MDGKDKFKFNFVLQCGLCKVRAHCPIPEKIVDGHHCDFEMDDYDRFMKALEQNYYVNEAIKILAEKVIAHLIIGMRIYRDLKFNGLTQRATTRLKDGSTIEQKVENVLKSGLHLDESRLIRILKEMKLTPREQTPKQVEISVKHMLEQIAREPQIVDYDFVPEIKEASGQMLKKKKKNAKSISD